MLAGSNQWSVTDTVDKRTKIVLEARRTPKSGPSSESRKKFSPKMVNEIPSYPFTVEKPRQSKTEHADIEEAIELCGYGRFHYGFLLLCGMIFLCAGCQNGVNAYILPSAECDLKMTSEQKGLLIVAFLVGGVLSAIVWGVLGDAYGRKNILVGTLLADSAVNLVASFSQSFKVLLIFRVISGFTIGCPGSLTYTYVGEFHAKNQRAKSICYVGFFWTLSWLILPGLAWLVIPLPFSVEFNGILYNSWRLFLAILALPTFLVALIAMTYPESPKFLVSQGRTKEALHVLKDMYARNTGRNRHEYPVKVLLSDTYANPKKHGINDSESGVITELLKSIWHQIRSLASPPLACYALLCCTIYFANMFGYYGLGLWLPELFNRFEVFYKNHPNVSASVCEVMSDQDHDLSSTNSLSQQKVCTGNIDERVFLNSVTINAVCLLANVISGFLSNRVGRRTMPIWSMLLAGCFAFCIYFVRSFWQNLIIACLFSLAITTANIVLNSVVVDIFPTHVGGVAICLTTCLGRLGAIASNLVFGMLLDVSCEVPIFLIAGILIFGGVLSFLIPQESRKEVPTIVKETITEENPS
ncbi:synaptic vesicle glycoprotein 2B isoform X2 [Orussus abietinus]|uniref:synaptic vesicle glycoprotein 2B isoform X2 n=1 Tax=Orussus abietinus TaxID=222816 RepID=UPI000625FE40|nr:synaptic vesicle glycoprotein 2B isoform X2 [Orussus abietinus]XP_012270504.1 synaptic vesicle glycoprotein 2B isoform X2 [Orussus abietinus]XP_012270505.1 synaptic vesicle glycoprotein 2B isoform X2 [Orussus abietinus]